MLFTLRPGSKPVTVDASEFQRLPCSTHVPQQLESEVLLSDVVLVLHLAEHLLVLRLVASSACPDGVADIPCLHFDVALRLVGFYPAFQAMEIPNRGNPFVEVLPGDDDSVDRGVHAAFSTDLFEVSSPASHCLPRVVTSEVNLPLASRHSEMLM